MLKGERVGYGEQIVSALSKQLETEHGRGFSTQNLRHMLRFAEVFEADEIVYALSRQLSWTHLRSPFHGYNNDPHELAAISEVREWFSLIQADFAYHRNSHHRDNRG